MADDLKWCFDTPANAVIELSLMRLGVPAFYATMLNDIDIHSAKSTVTAAGLTVDLAGHLGCRGVHRQLRSEVSKGFGGGLFTKIPEILAKKIAK